MGESLKHKSPETYVKDLKDALDEFEEALLWRYEVDLDDLSTIWTTHGYEPTLEDSSDVNEGREQFEQAKKHTSGWAADVRDWVKMSIVDYGTQNLYWLESAYDDLCSAAKLLGEGLDPGKDGPIFDVANDINTQCNFVTWAGASGEAFKKNFGNSTVPTLYTQAKIAGSLANLYSARTCIIESVRRNTINAFKRAAKALRETEDSGDETVTWIIVNVAILAVGVASAGAGVVLGAGALIGGYLDTEDPDQESTNDIKDIVKQLVDDLGKAGSEASSKEGELFDKVTKLQRDIASIKSNELELYDFAGGEYTPTAPADGFDVSVDDVYGLSELCLGASEAYEGVISNVISTDLADSELKGEGHVETAADAELIDVKDTFLSFLKTTCARYYEAFERLHDTARDYFGVETDNEEALKALEDGPDLNGDSDGSGGSVDDHLGESNRDDIEDVKDSEDPPEQSAPGGVEYGSGGTEGGGGDTDYLEDSDQSPPGGVEYGSGGA